MRTLFTLVLFICFQWGYSQSPTDSVTFENTPTLMFLDSLDGSWQVGTPSKTLFDSAYSSSHAIMTDTLLPYPSDSVSFFYLSFNSGMSTTYQLKFYHRYDFETSADGGFIQFYDYNTSTWLNLNDWGMSGI